MSSRSSAVGLFAGIGGIELGLRRAGFTPSVLCEIDKNARLVLTKRFPEAQQHGDVSTMRSLPACTVLAAGFPCQDLSQAGTTSGIHGRKSRLVRHVFELLDRRQSRVTWLVIENVPFMLQLHHGVAIRYITRRLDELGFAWAYRVIDARSFGVPQRRRRMFLVASRSEDPRSVLLSDDSRWRPEVPRDSAHGFYWTEGNTGIGWAENAVPPLKAGSAIGIASPPAIWFPSGLIGTPDIRDAERLQGFPANWTNADDVAPRARWRLVGSAVCVPITEWIGHRLLDPGEYEGDEDRRLSAADAWPTAAWGHKGKAYAATVSEWPVRRKYSHLATFLKYDAAPLSERATSGFYERLSASDLKIPKGFLGALRAHVSLMRRRDAAA